MPSQLFVYPSFPVILVYGSVLLLFYGSQLFFAFKEKERERKIIKPFCVLALMVMALLTFPEAYCLWLGLLFGVIGDIFFIFKDNQKCVYAGLVAFLINHVLFIVQTFLILNVMAEVAVSHIIIIICVYVAFLIGAFFAIRAFVKPPLPLAIAGSVYMTLLFLDLGIQIYGVALGGYYLLFGVFGGLLFILSDSILTYTMFIKDFRRRDFPIMLTYLSAQTLLTVGMILQIIQALGFD